MKKKTEKGEKTSNFNLRSIFHANKESEASEHLYVMANIVGQSRQNTKFRKPTKNRFVALQQPLTTDKIPKVIGSDSMRWDEMMRGVGNAKCDAGDRYHKSLNRMRVGSPRMSHGCAGQVPWSLDPWSECMLHVAFDDLQSSDTSKFPAAVSVFSRTHRCLCNQSWMTLPRMPLCNLNLVHRKKYICQNHFTCFVLALFWSHHDILILWNIWIGYLELVRIFPP